MRTYSSACALCLNLSLAPLSIGDDFDRSRPETENVEFISDSNVPRPNRRRSPVEISKTVYSPTPDEQQKPSPAESRTCRVYVEPGSSTTSKTIKLSRPAK
mmetsp:Transcript_11720/g.26779  ORF Transcript_11720/g.26779 Transcript_11720/m.26779 type:complete len:101 (+) Transcript_11720:2127-2429(+)